MSTIRVGDICILQNSVLPGYDGREVHVIGGLQVRRGREHFADGTNAVNEKLRYRIQCDDGEIIVPQPYKLRLKRPPSWNQWLYGVDHIREEIPHGNVRGDVIRVKAPT